MELKPRTVPATTAAIELLIVPYGIETSAARRKVANVYGPFNCTLWN